MGTKNIFAKKTDRRREIDRNRMAPINIFSNLPESGRGIALFAVLFARVLALVGLTVAATIIHCYMDPLIRRKKKEDAEQFELTMREATQCVQVNNPAFVPES